MGTQLKIPTPGVNCLNWDPPAEAPESIYCQFWDVKKGDRGGAREPPNEHIFRMEQMAGQPCSWKSVNLTYGWEVTFDLQSAAMNIHLQDAVLRDNTYFVDTVSSSPPDEYQVFTNELTTAYGNWGWDGHCIIFWMADAIIIAEEFGLLDAGDLMLEMFPAEAPYFVFKFCSLILRTNVSMKKNII